MTRIDVKPVPRPGESIEDATRRAATDAIYAARDAGLNMHQAGEFAAKMVLSMLDQMGQGPFQVARLEDELSEALEESS